MNYYEIAKRSYDNIDKQFKLAQEMDWYNLFASECEQIVEKFMKGLLETFCDETIPQRIFASHNLRRLAEHINDKYPNLVDIRAASWIEDFYFEARYPGDNFIIVSESQAQELLTCTKDLAEKLIEKIRVQNEGLTSFFGDLNNEETN